jgi:hypothetical protein
MSALVVDRYENPIDPVLIVEVDLCDPQTPQQQFLTDGTNGTCQP